MNLWLLVFISGLRAVCPGPLSGSPASECFKDAPKVSVQFFLDSKKAAVEYDLASNQSYAPRMFHLQVPPPEKWFSCANDMLSDEKCWQITEVYARPAKEYEIIEGQGMEPKP